MKTTNTMSAQVFAKAPPSWGGGGDGGGGEGGVGGSEGGVGGCTGGGSGANPGAYGGGGNVRAPQSSQSVPSEQAV